MRWRDLLIFDVPRLTTPLHNGRNIEQMVCCLVLYLNPSIEAASFAATNEQLLCFDLRPAAATFFLRFVQSRYLESGIVLDVLNQPEVFYSDGVQLEPNQNKSVQDQRIPVGGRTELLRAGPRQIDVVRSRMMQD